MKDIDKAFVRDTKFEKIRFVRNLRIPLVNKDFPDFNADGQWNAAIALLDKGEINCCGGSIGQPEPEEPEEPEVPEEPIITEEERLRIAAEETARIKAEAEAEARRKLEEEANLKAAARKNNFKLFGTKIRDFFSGLVSEKDN